MRVAEKDIARNKRCPKPCALNGNAFSTKKRKGIQRQCLRHKKPSINPFISLLIIILCTTAGCFAVRCTSGTMSGSAWLDGVCLFWLSAATFSHFWAKGLQRHCQKNERDAEDLADHDSLFCTVAGIKIHHKIEGYQGRTSRTMHLYHGFGTSLWTWEDAQAKLARRCHAVVSAHDMPGFGISDRPLAVSAYSLTFNGRIGRVIMNSVLSGGLSSALPDGKAIMTAPSKASATITGAGMLCMPRELRALAAPTDYAMRHPGSAPILAYYYATQSSSGRSISPPADVVGQQHNRQRILMGHSMGCSSASLEVLADPRGTEALVLVSPAILAVGFPGFGWAGRDRENPETEFKDSAPACHIVRNGLQALNGGSLPWAARQCSLQWGNWRDRTFVILVLRLVGRLMRIGLALLFLYVSAWAVVFQTWVHGTVRFAARSEGFWNWALRFTFHQKSCITRRKVWSYRRSMYLRGTENGIIPFSLSWLSMDGTGVCADIVDALTNPAPNTLCQRLSRMVRKTGLRVLVIQGDMDPSHKNGRRLAAAIPGAQLIEYSGCGHNPHEECPERFVQDVANFVNSLA